MLRRTVVAVLAAVTLASCSSDGSSPSPTPTSGYFDTTSTSLIPTTPIVARVLSPERGTVQGSGGKGMVVALTFTARDPGVLPAEFRLGGALPAPAAAAKPGQNPAFPGLVVGLSTTGTTLGGPSANLANLFQIVSPSAQLDGSRLVSAIWTNSQADFGIDVDATLVAFVVSGTAPDLIPPTQANIDVVSNAVEVTFRMSPSGDAPAAGGGPTTTGAPGASTTSSVKPTTTTTRPGATTSAPTTATTTPRLATTTAVPATTSTTKFLGGLFG